MKFADMTGEGELRMRTLVLAIAVVEAKSKNPKVVARHLAKHGFALRRDREFSEGDLKEVIADLKKNGLIKEEKGRFAYTKKGKEEVKKHGKFALHPPPLIG